MWPPAAIEKARTGRPLTERLGSSESLLIRSYLFLFLFLYASYLGIYVYSLKLVWLVAFPMAVAAWWYLPGAPSSQRFITALLSACYIYLAAMGALGTVPLLILLPAALYFVRSAPDDASLAWRVRALRIFILLSCALMIASTLSPDVASMRWKLYGSQRFLGGGEEEFETEFSRQGGLSRFIFWLGYQYAAAIPLIAGPVFLGIEKPFRSLAAFGGAAIAILLCGERGTVVAGGVGLLFLLAMARNKARAAAALLALSPLLVASYCLYEPLAPRREGADLVSRFATIEDYHDRLAIQILALEMIVRHPLGMMYAGRDFMEEAFSRGLPPHSPHNGFLTAAVCYGWPVLVFEIAILVRLAVMCFETVRCRDSSASAAWEKTCCAAMVSNFLFALFHNASFLSGEPVSVLLMFLYSAWYEKRRAVPLPDGGRGSQPVSGEASFAPMPTAVAVTGGPAGRSASAAGSGR
ncbi:MAG: hypothetical protein N3A38_03530 [Planctomycetota bacterium]|nr:hypothetical protein [Planctomycetota bacterium]